MTSTRRFFSLSLLTLLALSGAHADDSETRRYTFSWLYADDTAMAPRGGTTRGPEVTLADGASDAWAALQAPDLSPRERDRRAILAMAGPHRTTFDFIETIGFSEAYTPSKPYQSWGTEYVYVVDDEPDFVSLQHILVMRVQRDDGSLSEPMVVKHWRHDWRYEDRQLRSFAGFNTWEQQQLTAAEAEGTWSQTVYQVDDSPRYETYGRWVHRPGYSHWESARALRPLPRREFSIRDDYHALDGSMRITITPQGWVMEEDALKLVLAEDGTPRAEQPYLAREAGISRYERIVGYDFSAGDDYWRRTGAFWAAVRDYWRDRYADAEDIQLRKRVDDQRLFVAMFELAEKYAGDDADPAAMRDELRATVAPYLRREDGATAPPAGDAGGG